MADSTDAIRQNIIGVTDLVTNKTNKVPGAAFNADEGATGEPEDILTLKDSDEELLLLARKREASYAGYGAKIDRRQKKNLKYYLGAGLGDTGYVEEDPIAANFMFEAEETFLPAALSKNPEPVVYSDNTPEGNKLSSDVKTMLQYHADSLVLRRKLQHMTRQWSIYLLGVLKHGWDEEISEIRTDVRKVQDFIFDPNGSVDVYGDFDSWLGERITVSAEKLAEMFPKHKAYIYAQVDNKKGTDCTYTEWWTDEMCYYTFKDVVLDKHKNEFFNHPQETTDEYGLPTTQKGENHFAKPKKPYTFLSVFSLGEHPHDVTGLIEQNIPNQNLVSKRTRQLDYNLSRANNSTAFSEDNFNQQTAKQAAQAWVKGNPILVPAGRPISEAIKDFPPPTVPDSFFKEQENNISNLRSIFGVQGISAQQPDEDTTARGMILNQQYDNTRIGGGIGEAIEQVADNVFNWWVQLYYVYYDEPHFAAVLGQMKAVEYIEFSAQSLDRQLIVSVAPDSMKGHDEITEINQAVQYFQMGVIGPKTLLTIANFPNPDESAADGLLYKLNPQAYLQLNFPEEAQKLQQMAQQQAQMQAMGAQIAGPGGAPQPESPQAPPTLATPEASPSLSNVPLPQ